MLVGSKPFPTEDINLALKMQTSHDVPDPINHAPDIPDELRQFILTACNRDPAQRYQNVNQALLELQYYHHLMQAKYSRPAPPSERMRVLYELNFNTRHQSTLLELITEFNLKLKKLDTQLTPIDFKEIEINRQ